MAEISVWEESIHSMDSGSLHFVVKIEGHTLSYTPVWFNCGETGENFTCSCGFHTESREGHGCWQQGHDEAKKPEWDKTHADLFSLGLDEASFLGLGYPALIQGLRWELLHSLFDNLFKVLRAGLLKRD